MCHQSIVTGFPPAVDGATEAGPDEPPAEGAAVDGAGVPPPEQAAKAIAAVARRTAIRDLIGLASSGVVDMAGCASWRGGRCRLLRCDHLPARSEPGRFPRARSRPAREEETGGTESAVSHFDIAVIDGPAAAVSSSKVAGQASIVSARSL